MNQMRKKNPKNTLQVIIAETLLYQVILWKYLNIHEKRMSKSVVKTKIIKILFHKYNTTNAKKATIIQTGRRSLLSDFIQNS